jgi:polyribonucleotide nucleotidyltransferase
MEVISMKSIKKILLFTVFTAMIQVSQVHPDAKIQKQIRDVVQKHQSKANIIKTKDELQKFLEILKKDLKDILKHAPNTTQYKELKKAIDQLNPKEMAANFDHIKTILKNVDSDIKDSILSFIPFQFKAFFLF